MDNSEEKTKEVAVAATEVPSAPEKDELAELIISRVEGYIRDLDGAKGLPLHGMIVTAVEKPLFRWALKKTRGNQKAAAKILGINRNTLHKKLCDQGYDRRKWKNA